MNKEQPLLSIICPIYNQEEFIAQTLESFLMQKTQYPFEIIVHDDASTDKTAEIVKNYEIKYPGIFANIYQTENQFSKTINSVTKITFAAARGKYLALCEGDDYWTDVYKIERQIKLLEEHPEFVGCFHNTEERYEKDDSKASFLYCSFQSARAVPFAELAYSNCIPTCSVIFRKSLFKEFPIWFDALKMGDWPLHLLNSQFGDYWYLPKVMGVHRLHIKSMWMLQDAELNKKHTIDAYDTMIAGFASRPELQKQLIISKDSFINPTSYVHPSLARRGVDYIKRIIKQ
jgi:glycosyltransferase involved in cell wall biosynthesis